MGVHTGLFENGTFFELSWRMDEMIPQITEQPESGSRLMEERACRIPVAL